MNLNEILSDTDKPLAVEKIYKESGVVTLLSIKKEAILKEHQSRTNALLILLKGNAIYEESDRQVHLTEVHDFVHIPEKVTHKVSVSEDSLLLLIQ